MGGTNCAADIVADYFDKKLLAELGHTFSSDITHFEVQCYKIIQSELSKCEDQERKKLARKK